MKRDILEGTTINDWKILAFEGNDGKKSRYWCQCSCCEGIYLRRADKLKAGRTKRCQGCSSWYGKKENLKKEEVYKMPIKKEKRERVYKKYEGHCAYCGKEIAYNQMEIDYIEPIKMGGSTEFGNMIPSCRICNRKRDGKSLEKFRAKLKQIPGILERDSEYRIAKRYGLIQEQDIAVKFFFETFRKSKKSIDVMK